MSQQISKETEIDMGQHKVRLCPECGIPEEIAKNYLWLNSGVMVQSTNLSKRMGFIESENLDPLYNSIGNIIGEPIDRLVIDVARRHTLDLGANLIQPEVRGMLRNKVLGLNFIVDFVAAMGRLNGSGNYRVLDVRHERDENDYLLTTITEPFSLPIAVGINIGCCEVITETPHKATYREISPGVYEIKCYISEHDQELEGSMPIREYHHRDGDIELEKCSTCGCPAALSWFKWYLERGVIMNTSTGRRLKIADPGIQDLIFEELERDVGEIVPAAVVEAQRRFIRSGLYSPKEINDKDDFRTQLALRGMGNLKELKVDARGLRMSIDNAADYLMLVGLAQGLFEMAFDVESNVEWEISEQGDLVVEVTPA